MTYPTLGDDRDDEATMLRAEPVRGAADDEETAVLRPVLLARPAPHRTAEESADTESCELQPLQLDWSALG